MGKNAGFMLTIEGGGKAIAYHREQEPEFIPLDKVYIHYLGEDFKPIIIDGKPKKGLITRSKLTLIGYTD